MRKVITYGTYDLLHQGHINLLTRAKALGDYLIVGVTSEDYDITRGKLSVTQSLSERIEAVRSTGLADKIIVEEYDGQKIEDIQRYDVDIFTVGSDWIGTFDYLNDYCKVVYLPRTEGVSSTDIRINNNNISIGVAGYSSLAEKFVRESKKVNGVNVKYICTKEFMNDNKDEDIQALMINDYEKMLDDVDAVYVIADTNDRQELSKIALMHKKHVLCESPISMDKAGAEELFYLAETNNCIFMEAIRTAYSIAFKRLCLLAKTGKIGDIYSVEATCTSLAANKYKRSVCGALGNWGANAMLPVFKILGTNDYSAEIVSVVNNNKDIFTNIHFKYDHAVANIKVGTGVKSEGELIVSGTKGYIFVPAPWWKTDYFEVRRENSHENERYFFSLPGEGIRYEISAFAKAIFNNRKNIGIEKDITLAISSIMEQFDKKNNYIEI